MFQIGPDLVSPFDQEWQPSVDSNYEVRNLTVDVAVPCDTGSHEWPQESQEDVYQPMG